MNIFIIMIYMRITDHDSELIEDMHEEIKQLMNQQTGNIINISASGLKCCQRRMTHLKKTKTFGMYEAYNSSNERK